MAIDKNAIATEMERVSKLLSAMAEQGAQMQSMEAVVNYATALLEFDKAMSVAHITMYENKYFADSGE